VAPDSLLQHLLDGLRATSAPEAVAVVLGLAYAVLAARNSRWCWVAGAASSAILALLAWQARLPMQAGLNIAYVGLSLYGWLQWSRAATTRIIVWPRWHHAVAIAVTLALAAALAALLPSGLQAAWPYLDSATTLLSVLATWLVARHVLANWLYWIAIDAVLVFLFAAQQLMFVALQFVIYLFIAVIGYRAWLRSYRQQTGT
jgi:nicotinamide mononucleotide transporter